MVLEQTDIVTLDGRVVPVKVMDRHSRHDAPRDFNFEGDKTALLRCLRMEANGSGIPVAAYTVVDNGESLYSIWRELT